MTRAFAYQTSMRRIHSFSSRGTSNSFPWRDEYAAVVCWPLAPCQMVASTRTSSQRTSIESMSVCSKATLYGNKCIYCYIWDLKNFDSSTSDSYIYANCFMRVCYLVCVICEGSRFMKSIYVWLRGAFMLIKYLGLSLKEFAYMSCVTYLYIKIP